MNDLKVTKEILNSIYDNSGFKAEVAEFINSLIDEEFLKDEPNCDFIDECINTLDELENENFAKVIPFVKKHANKSVRQRLISVAAACAILAAISFGAVAVSHTIEQKREAKTTTLPAATQEVTAERTTTEVITTTTAAPTTRAAVPAELRLGFTDKFKDEYFIGEALDASGITAVMIYSDGSEKTIPLDGCKITTDNGFGTTERYETVRVSYGGFSKTFRVRVLRKKETKVLNSVYATFPQGYDFTAEDVENADLSGMKVFAVYSDKSEKELSAKEYRIEKEKIDKRTVLYTISYEGCSTGFGIRERR